MECNENSNCTRANNRNNLRPVPSDGLILVTTIICLVFLHQVLFAATAVSSLCVNWITSSVCTVLPLLNILAPETTFDTKLVVC